MPPPDKDYSKGITFSPDAPSLCDDRWLLIGSMSAKPMKGSDVKSDALYYTSLGNSKNIAWGEKKEACELADYIGNDGTTLTLKFESWIPSQQDFADKHQLQNSITNKADQVFREMTSSPSPTDSENDQNSTSFYQRRPVDEEAVIESAHRVLNLPRYRGELEDFVSPREALMLSHWRRDCMLEGEILEEIEDYREYASEVMARSRGGQSGVSAQGDTNDGSTLGASMSATKET